jgi:hypothetical protein
MILVVTGGRDYKDRDLVFTVLDRVHKETPITMLIHGACGWDRDKRMVAMTGADRWADEWANERGVGFRRVAARWSALGGQAGPIRNGEMLAMGPDMVLAFPGQAGTWNCIRQARGRGIIVEHAAREAKDAHAALVTELSTPNGSVGER